MLMFLLGLAPQAHATDALLGLNADVGVVAPPDRIGGATHTDHGVSIAFFLPGDTVPTDEQGEVDGRDLVRLGAGLISIDIGRGLGIDRGATCRSVAASASAWVARLWQWRVAQP